MSVLELEYIIHHVFLPPKLPQEDDTNPERDRALATLVYDASVAFTDSRWDPIKKMLENIRESVTLTSYHIERSIREMQPRDVVALLIRAQNAGVIIRKFLRLTIFEFFEVAVPNSRVMEANKLLCTYPGPAVQVSNNVVEDLTFQRELASFLVQMNVDELDSAATTKKAGSVVVERRDSAHPRYITQLLSEILRGMGEAVKTTRIQKRVADDVLWNHAYLPWRRSPLWLVIRVALQTTLCRQSDGNAEYKAFMVYLMSEILRKAVEQESSSDLLFCMRAKLTRRLYKIRSTVPDFVLRKVEVAVANTGKLLQQRWDCVQAKHTQTLSAPWVPGDLDFEGDTRLSLNNSKSYISKILDGTSMISQSSTFKPNNHQRLSHFASGELKDAFTADPAVALSDFETSVQNDIDDWVIVNINDQSAIPLIAACIQSYYDVAQRFYGSNPEDLSIMFLTLFELWVGLDKMAVNQFPLLKDYSPEVPLYLLHPLLLRKSSSIKRLEVVESYIRGRHAVGYGSVFRDAVDCETIAVRYYDKSPQLKNLRKKIEKNAHNKKKTKTSGAGAAERQVSFSYGQSTA